MKCAKVVVLGDTDEALIFKEDEPKPKWTPKKGEMLIKVQATSLHAGDTKILSGDVSFILPKKIPYIPCSDICGIVEQVDETDREFKIGDTVISSSDWSPCNGLAEYVVVKTKETVKKPENLTVLEAAALPVSASTALDSIHLAGSIKNRRVLIIGGSGGVGTFLVQLCKIYGASFIASTSTNVELVTSLGANQVIDYRNQNWWEVPDFKENPFDVVFDCVGGQDSWISAKLRCIKSGRRGGKYIAIVGDEANAKFHSLGQIIKFACSLLSRPLWTFLNRSLPRYKCLISSVSKKGLQTLVKHVESDGLKPLLDPSTPFSFDEKGVKDAFRLQGSRHAKGKIVIQVS